MGSSCAQAGACATCCPLLRLPPQLSMQHTAAQDVFSQHAEHGPQTPPSHNQQPQQQPHSQQQQQQHQQGGQEPGSASCSAPAASTPSAAPQDLDPNDVVTGVPVADYAQQWQAMAAQQQAVMAWYGQAWLAQMHQGSFASHPGGALPQGLGMAAHSQVRVCMGQRCVVCCVGWATTGTG